MIDWQNVLGQLGRKRILIAPLDWGLGHAVRLVPVINELLENGHNILLAADKAPLQFLRMEFPQLLWIQFPGTAVKYSGSKSQIIKMLFLLPSFLLSIRREHKKLNTIIRIHNIDIVISDNRYGAWSKSAYCIILTHQLMLKMPVGMKFLEGFIHRFILHFIKNFDECWIPDFKEKPGLSGDLSHKYPLPANARFIGPLSRFNNLEKITPDINCCDILVILSGPEPQRTLLEQLLTEQLTISDLQTIVLRGKPEEEKSPEIAGNITFYNHLTTSEICKLIGNSKIVICRSGYSSIMDLIALQKKEAILIPTPGQTEQEYLAEYYKTRNFYYSETQNNFNLYKAMKEMNDYNPIFDIKVRTSQMLKISSFQKQE
ncbi:MAG: glycosyl transferase family 28 [Bacteroidia bacterium]|nr:glycosyl transferase family 28 [Bacteroidia bacterium]